MTRNTPQLLRNTLNVACYVAIPSPAYAYAYAYVPSQEKKKPMYGVYLHPLHQEAPQPNPWAGRGNHTTLTPSASLGASRPQHGGVL